MSTNIQTMFNDIDKPFLAETKQQKLEKMITSGVKDISPKKKKKVDVFTRLDKGHYNAKNKN